MKVITASQEIHGLEPVAQKAQLDYGDHNSGHPEGTEGFRRQELRRFALQHGTI